MERSLYLAGKELGRYSQKALDLDRATVDAVAKLFWQHLREGYSPREVAHVMQGAISMLEHESMLQLSEGKGAEE